MKELGDTLGGRPVLTREVLCDGRVLRFEAQEFELGGTRIRREVSVHPGAVGVLALDDQDRVCLVYQYRHPVGATLWELPAGLLDVPGEDPLEAAKRELAEEADLVADTWSTLVDVAPSPGGSSEIIRVYLAEQVRDAPEVFARTDEEAVMVSQWVPFDEVVEAALSMRLHNAALVAAVLALSAMRARGRAAHPADVPFDWHPTSR